MCNNEKNTDLIKNLFKIDFNRANTAINFDMSSPRAIPPNKTVTDETRSLDGSLSNHECSFSDTGIHIHRPDDRFTHFYDNFTDADVDLLLAVMNPTLPSYRAVSRILTLCRQLPINIGHRAILVNRVGPEGAGEQIDRELAQLDGRRLGDVPQDGEVERAGAAGQDVFSLPENSPALIAVRNAIEALRAMLPIADKR